MFNQMMDCHRNDSKNGAKSDNGASHKHPQYERN